MKIKVDTFTSKLNLFWAIAPEYASQLQEVYNANLSSDSLNKEVKESRSQLGKDDPVPLLMEKDEDVAVIRIDGPIDRITRISSFDDSIYSLGQDAIYEAINAALKDPAIKATLLSFNSPGGVVAGTKELADFIAEAGRIKPMAAYVNGLCASAAFWLASATGRIFAPMTAQIGSVGVIMMIPNMAGYYQRMGVKLEYIASGKFKTAGRGDRELTEEERNYFQKKITSLHEIFKTDVRNLLNITKQDSEWADAQLFLAEDALALGLINGIVRDESSAIAKLKEEIMPQKITMEILKADAPELIEQIKAEALAAINTESDDSIALAIMKQICSEDQYKAASTLFNTAKDLGLTAEQATDLFAAFKAMPPTNALEARLAEIRDSYPAPLNADDPAKAFSPLMADVERRIAKAKEKQTC